MPESSTSKSLIPAEVRENFLPTHLDKTTVGIIIEHLPESDATLDEWITVMTRENEWCGVILTTLAALAAARPVDSRHLLAIIRFAPNPEYLAMIAWKMTGDIGANLLAAVNGNMLGDDTVTMALLVATLWHQKQGATTLPTDLLAALRLRFREVIGSKATPSTRLHAIVLAHIATLSGDDSLIAFIKRTAPRILNDEFATRAKLHATTIEMLGEHPVLDMIHDRREAYKPHQGTVRRSVEKHNRNEQCPCGSGKKYKRCCEEKDRLRLRESSSIPGMTRDEVHLSPEANLTEKRILATTALEVSRWDFTKIDPSLHTLCLKQLAKYWYVEEAAAAFEITGYTDEMEDAWKHSTWGCVFLWKRAPLLRLVALREKINGGPFELDSGIRLLLEGETPTDIAHRLEALAREAIATSKEENLRDLAWALLHSPMKALGILVARSALPLCPTDEATKLLDLILKTHDKLSLPPDDPFSDIHEKRLADESQTKGHDSEPLRKARRDLDEKAAEVRRLKLTLDSTRQEIDRRERKLAARAQTPAPAPADDEKLRDLRLKVNELNLPLHPQRRTHPAPKRTPARPNRPRKPPPKIHRKKHPRPRPRRPRRRPTHTRRRHGRPARPPHRIPPQIPAPPRRPPARHRPPIHASPRPPRLRRPPHLLPDRPTQSPPKNIPHPHRRRLPDVLPAPAPRRPGRGRLPPARARQKNKIPHRLRRIAPQN